MERYLIIISLYSLKEIMVSLRDGSNEGSQDKFVFYEELMNIIKIPLIITKTSFLSRALSISYFYTTF